MEMDSKMVIRQKINTLREAYRGMEKTRSDHTILNTTLEFLDQFHAQTICTYYSTVNEVDTHGLVSSLLRKGVSVVIPRVSQDTQGTLKRIERAGDIVPGLCGIPEPKHSCPSVSMSSIDACIVPGVAFDRSGYRIGMGKGYYDRLLAYASVRKIGLAYAFQLVVSGLPHDEYDIPMDTIITEKEVLRMEEHE